MASINTLFDIIDKENTTVIHLMRLTHNYIAMKPVLTYYLLILEVLLITYLN